MSFIQISWKRISASSRWHSSNSWKMSSVHFLLQLLSFIGIYHICPAAYWSDPTKSCCCYLSAVYKHNSLFWSSLQVFKSFTEQHYAGKEKLYVSPVKNPCKTVLKNVIKYRAHEKKGLIALLGDRKTACRCFMQQYRWASFYACNISGYFSCGCRLCHSRSCSPWVTKAWARISTMKLIAALIADINVHNPACLALRRCNLTHFINHYCRLD